ncbi:MAG: CHAT domain-containing protein [Bacteroidota bacterium]
MTTFSPPASYEVVTEVTGTKTRTRSGGTSEAARSPEDPLVNALTETGLALDAWAEYAVTSGKASDGRRTPSSRRSLETDVDSTVLNIDVDLAPGEQAMVLVEQDGHYSWAFQPDETTAEEAPTTGGRKRSGAKLDTVRFSVDLRAAGEMSGTRSFGWIKKKIADRVSAFVLKFAAKVVAKHTMKFLERHVQTGLVVISRKQVEKEPPASLYSHAKWTLHRDPATLKLPEDRPPRILLMVHGTFSSTVGSYGALGETDAGKAFLREAARTYDLILGFDHATLSEDPMENALRLEELLSELPWRRDAPPVFDAVAFSRGSLVLRSLIEVVLPDTQLPFKFERAILVGATNGGTQLAEPDNWKALIDLYTNLIGGASRLLSLVAPGAAGAAGIVSGLLSGIGSFAKYLATESVTRGGVPGLAAMEPQGDFVTTLNAHNPGQPGAGSLSYYAITSDFEFDGDLDAHPELPKRLLIQLADGFVDRLMGHRNDLVVDTPSMTQVDIDTPGLLRQVYALGTNPHVYHTVYFVQPQVVKALAEWLNLKVPSKRAMDRSGNYEFKPIREEYRSLTKGAFSAAAVARSGEPAVPPFSVEVVWGDLRHIEADVYAVGHYQGVLPQRAELALDQVVSSKQWHKVKTRPEDLLLTQLTRRGHLVGELGDLDLFPLAGDGTRLAAICGMGYPGTFDEYALRILQKNLVAVLNLFPAERHLCTVLIGSGEGGLNIDASVRGAVDGYIEALRAAGPPARVQQITIAELYRHRAEEIHEALGRVLAERELGDIVTLHPEVRTRRGGLHSHSHRLGIVLATIAQAHERNDTSASKVLKPLMASLPDGPTQDEYREALGVFASGSNGDVARMARRIETREDDAALGASAVPTRVSFIRSDALLKAAAITNTTTVPERIIDVDPQLTMEAVRRMHDPNPADLASLSDMLLRLVVPRDFRPLLQGSNPLILEVDRHTASIHWEMLAASVQEGRSRPIGLFREVSRQLRTSYSGPPAARSQPQQPLKALVIGDPDDSLPGARMEAIEVWKLLSKRGVKTELLLGSRRHAGDPTDSSVAGRFNTLERLIRGKFDLVHFAGHGTYDALDPSQTGWVFQDGLLRAAEIRRLDTSPFLVFANACLSGRLAGAEATLYDARRPYGEAGLLPSLADEFFQRGVRNYIGTAWEVDDDGAVEFARRFYDRFIPGRDRLAGDPVGASIQSARVSLHRAERKYKALWGAYQHYGDPNFHVRL